MLKRDEVLLIFLFPLSFSKGEGDKGGEVSKIGGNRFAGL